MDNSARRFLYPLRFEKKPIYMMMDDMNMDNDENIDKSTFIKNQIISLNMRLSKKRFGGNTTANKCGDDSDYDSLSWLNNNPEALLITEKILEEVGKKYYNIAQSNHS